MRQFFIGDQYFSMLSFIKGGIETEDWNNIGIEII